MSYHVQILPTAEREFERQFQYLVRRSRRGAIAWANAFYKALKALKVDPETQPLAPEGQDHEIVLREILFKTRKGMTYRALFTVRGKEVFVLHIRGPGQDFMSTDDLVLPD